MRVENNQKLSINNSVDYNSKTNIDNRYYNLESKPDSVSFSGNINKPAKGLLGKLEDVLLFPINIIKKAQEKAKLKEKLRQEAEEAERIAKIKAQKAAREAAKIKRKSAAIELLNDWRVRNKGKFDRAIYTDNTGDVRLVQGEAPNPQIKNRPPKRGEYTLEHFRASGYSSKPVGQACWYLRGLKGDRPLITTLEEYFEWGEPFADCSWRIKYINWSNKAKGPCRCTLLTTGFPDKYAYALSRLPGIHILIEGEIPLKDINIIKKNIVEKGLWKNFIENQDNDSTIGLFNEFIKYLNR